MRSEYIRRTAQASNTKEASLRWFLKTELPVRRKRGGSQRLVDVVKQGWCDKGERRTERRTIF